MPFKTPGEKSRYDRERYRANREVFYKRIKERQMVLRKLAVEGKDHPCVDCGNEYPPYVMDYDHRDPTIKDGAISNMVQNSVRIEILLAEIAKCDVVCSNCHRIRTWRRKHWTELPLDTEGTLVVSGQGEDDGVLDCLSRQSTA